VGYKYPLYRPSSSDMRMACSRRPHSIRVVWHNQVSVAGFGSVFGRSCRSMGAS
jgi:hypothetical protein